MLRSCIALVLAVVVSMAWSSTRICAQVGTAVHQQKVSSTEGDFTGPLQAAGGFGYSVAALGDLNGDGTTELAVNGTFTTWILSLGPDGRVVGQTELHPLERELNASLARVGDVDGDGVTDIARGYNEGLSWFVEIMFLNTDRTLKASHEIAASDPAFGVLMAADAGFGYGLAGIGDVNADGVPDIAVGAPYDDNGPGINNGALWIVRLQPDGRVKSAQKISEMWGGGAGKLDTNFFALAVAPIGDLDGDGNLDLLVSNPGYPTAGSDVQKFSLIVLYLDQNERLLRASEVLQEEFGLVDATGKKFQCGFGYSLAALGDIDRDGTIEFAVGAPLWTPAPEVRQPGAFLVGSLRRDGTLARHVLLSSGIGGFTTDLLPQTAFGTGLSLLGDLDVDGNPELAVGAGHDNDGSGGNGAVWITELASSAVRNGSGVNPLTLAQDEEPAVGRYWKVSLNCAGHARGLAQVAGFARPDAGRATLAGELLVDLTSRRFFHLATPHNGVGSVLFRQLVPNNPALIGLDFYVQGMVTGAPGPQLSNALDVIIGR